MPVMNFDLEDGLPPVSFTLKPADCQRFMEFMAECTDAIKSKQAAPTPPAQDERFGVAAMIMRDVCELPQDDPEDPQTICINADTLQRLIGEHLAPPPQEAEPVAVIDECDEGKFAELTTEGTWLKIGTKLYTHAPSEKLRQAAERDYDFYRGVLVCLQHMSAAGDDTTFREVVKEIGVEGLMKVAIEEEALDWSGLRNYGYCKNLRSALEGK